MNEAEPSTACPLCRAVEVDAVAGNAFAAVIADAFPLNPGHHLVVSRRHEPDYFALSGPETDALWALVADARHRIQATHHPQGFNIGVNVGEVAGQTIPHVHVHVIPRYRGDVFEPKGGVRWILPERARYWE